MRLLLVWLVTLQMQCGGWAALNAADGIALEILPVQDASVYFGEATTRQYRLTNNSQKTVHIKPMQQCGCVAMDRTEIVLPQGSSHVGTVKIDSLLVKNNTRPTLVFSTDCPATPELNQPIDVRIVPFLEAMRPSAKVLAYVPGGAQEVFRVQLRARNACELIRVRAQTEFATAEFEELARVKDGIDFQIRIEIDDSTPLAQSQIPIVVETSSKRWPAMLLQIRFSRGIAVAPDKIDLGIVKRGQVPSVKLLVLQDHGVAFRILRVDTDASIAINWLTTPGGTGIRSHRAKVIFEREDEAGSHQSEILLHTDRRDQPTIRVPVRYVVE